MSEHSLFQLAPCNACISAKRYVIQNCLIDYSKCLCYREGELWDARGGFLCSMPKGPNDRQEQEQGQKNEQEKEQEQNQEQ